MDASTRAALDLDARAKALELALGKEPSAAVDRITDTASKFLHFLERGEPAEPVLIPEDRDYYWTAGFERRAAAFLQDDVPLEFRELQVGVICAKFAWRVGITPPTEDFLKSAALGLAMLGEEFYFEMRRIRMPTMKAWGRTERSPEDPDGLAV